MVTAIQQPGHCLWRVRNPYRRGPLTNRLALMTDGDWRDGGFRQRRPSVETLAWVAASMGRGSRIVGYVYAVDGEGVDAVVQVAASVGDVGSAGQSVGVECQIAETRQSPRRGTGALLG